LFVLFVFAVFIIAGCGDDHNDSSTAPVPQDVYVANYVDNAGSQSTIGADGSLNAMIPAMVAAGPHSVSVITIARRKTPRR